MINVSLSEWTENNGDLPRSRSLDTARREIGISRSELWLRCLALGGLSTPAELDSYLQETVQPDPGEYDVIAQALNEGFLALGRDHPLPYSWSAAESQA